MFGFEPCCHPELKRMLCMQEKTKIWLYQCLQTKHVRQTAWDWMVLLCPLKTLIAIKIVHRNQCFVKPELSISHCVCYSFSIFIFCILVLMKELWSRNTSDCGSVGSPSYVRWRCTSRISAWCRVHSLCWWSVTLIPNSRRTNITQGLHQHLRHPNLHQMLFSYISVWFSVRRNSSSEPFLNLMNSSIRSLVMSEWINIFTKALFVLREIPNQRCNIRLIIRSMSSVSCVNVPQTVTHTAV